MSFDIGSAKKEGYSDQEIADFLEKNHPNFKVKDAINEGYSLEEISNELTKPSKYKPKTLAGKVVEKIKNVLPYSFPLGPKLNPASIYKDLESKNVENTYYNLLPQLEIGAENVSSAFNKAVDSPKLPLLNDINLPIPGFRKINPAKAVSSVFPPRPSMAMLAAGGAIESEPIAIGESYGKSIMENAIPSTSKEIKHSIRFGGKDAADLVLDRPELGNTRFDILKNSRIGIENLENKIQDFLNVASENARKGTGKNIEIKGIPMLPAPINPQEISPSEGLIGTRNIYKFSEPKIGTIPSYEPENLNLITKGKKFTKGESKGLFNPGESEIESKHNEMIKQSRRETLKKLEGMKLPEPENYGFKIPNKFAIGKDEFLQVFDEAITKQSRIPTAGKEVKMLKKLKQEYLNSAPDVADVNYWNQVKRDIYERLGDNAYVSDITSAQKRLEKNFASKIAGLISDRIPGLKELNRSQGDLLEIRDAVIESSPKEIRDVSLLRPIMERLAISGSRFLTKPRRVFTGRGPLNIPLINK